MLPNLKGGFNDTGCNVRFISAEAIIARVVLGVCHTLGPDVQHFSKDSRQVFSLSPEFSDFFQL